MLLAQLIALLAVGALQPSAPPATGPCTTRHPVVLHGSLAEAPGSVQDDFKSRVGAIAEAGQPAGMGDFGPRTLPPRRFVKAAHSGDRWFIWYEHGGYGTHFHVVGYQLGVLGSTSKPAAILIGNLTAFNPCAATDAFLDGVRPADSRDW